MFKFSQEILNLEGHLNRSTGSRVTALLLNGWILPFGGASAVEGLLSTGYITSSFQAFNYIKLIFFNTKLRYDRLDVLLSWEPRPVINNHIFQDPLIVRNSKQSVKAQFNHALTNCLRTPTGRQEGGAWGIFHVTHWNISLDSVSKSISYNLLFSQCCLCTVD